MLAIAGLIVAACLTSVCCLTGKAATGAPAAQSFRWWKDALTGSRLIAASLAGFDPNPRFYQEPTDEQLRTALAKTRALFDGLVFYGTSTYTLRVLAEARRQAFRTVVLGAWNPRDEKELALACEAAKQFPEMACLVVLGNEGLLTRRYEEADLEKAAAFVRQDCPGLPVTTTEPIDSYGDDFLLRFGDGPLAPNVHPWFSHQREPQAAVKWVFERVHTLQKLSGGRFVLVKETGLPSGGDPEASPEGQAAFWVDLFKAPPQPGVALACFENADLEWKQRDSGLAVESHWGFWTADGIPKPVVGALTQLWGTKPPQAP